MATELSLMQEITDALNLSQLNGSERDEIFSEIEELVFKASLVRLLEEMNENVLEEFEALITKDANENQIYAFLLQNAPNAQEVAREALAELTDDILEVTQG